MSNGAIVYVKDGKEIPGDVYVQYTDPRAGDVATRPMDMRSGQMSMAGVTTATLDPMPDDFYGTVAKDPANPGKWVLTPYPPDEMHRRLRDYSRTRRVLVDSSGLILTWGPYATASDVDTRAKYNSGSVTTTADPTLQLTVKLLPISVGVISGSEQFITLTKAQVDQTNSELTRFLNACYNVEASTANSIDGGIITTKEQVSAAYNNLQNKNPRPQGSTALARNELEEIPELELEARITKRKIKEKKGKKR